MTFAHSAETRAAAMRMHQSGLTPSAISAQLNIPRKTVQHWVYAKAEEDEKREVVVQRKTSSGSGVIAPRPYRTGYVYGAGW
jgi:hypothetical protein